MRHSLRVAGREKLRETKYVRTFCLTYQSNRVGSRTTISVFISMVEEILSKIEKFGDAGAETTSIAETNEDTPSERRTEMVVGSFHKRYSPLFY